MDELASIVLIVFVYFPIFYIRLQEDLQNYLNGRIFDECIIRKMGLQSYDPYAIKSYSFTVRKTNSFFSLPTVLLSIAIVGISVALNINTVNHLWLDLSDLDIQASNSLELPEAFTDTLLCAKTSSASNKNRISIFRNSESQQLLFPVVTEEQVTASYPELAAQIGPGFGCVNLAGLTFESGDDQIFIEVQDPSATLYLQGTSLDSALTDKRDAARTMSNNNSFSLAVGISMTCIKIIKNDRLYLHYDPLVINTFHSQSSTNPIYVTPPFTGNFSYFYFQLHFPKFADPINLPQSYNLQTVIFTRKNIGQIFGAVLSWASILVIIVGLLAAPLMDHMLNLQTAESLFHLEPQFHNPSLPKFIIANIKSGFFPKEDRYVQMCEKVQKMKDVGTIVKIQMMLSRLVPRCRRKKTQELISSEQSFNQVIKTEVGVDLYSDKESCKTLQLDVSPDEKPENCLTTLRKKLLYLFDSGSDTVSISYRKKGIGSKRSLIITVIAVCGLLAFMVIFGLLKSDTSVSRYQALETEQTLTIPAYTIFLSELASQSQPLIRIMDGNYNIIENLTFATNTTCSQHLTSTQLTSLTGGTYKYLRCNPNPIELVLSSDLTANRYINIDESNLAAKNPYLIYMTRDHNIPNYTPMNNPAYSRDTVDNYYFVLPIIKIHSQTTSEQIQSYEIGTYYPIINTLDRIKGQLLTLSSSSFTIEQSSSDFFEAIENIWTFTVILFTVIVMKFTKYVNLQEKQASRTAEKAEFRDSICIFLAKTDGLLHGRHRAQLQAMKYYSKQRMPLE